MVSKKGAGFDWAVHEIEKTCKPVIVSTDKEKTPSLVAKIASSFRAKVVTPREDLSVNWKKEVTKGLPIKNTHERDALAAALYAYNLFASKIRQVRAELKRNEDRIIANTILGKPLANSIKQITNQDEETEIDETKRLKKEVEKGKRLIKELKKQLKLKPKVIQTKTIRLDTKIIKEREEEVKRLKERIKRIGELLELVMNGKLAIAEEPPPGHEVIEKVGRVYITREKEVGKRVKEKELEEMVEDYRRKRLKNKIKS